MSSRERILVGVDESEASDRAIAYVGEIAAKCGSFEVTILHILQPLPPRLLEFRGAESPHDERQLKDELDDKQSGWLDEQRRRAQQTVEKASAALRATGVAADQIQVKLSEHKSGESVAEHLLAQAKKNDCHTVVTGRGAFSWVKEMFRSHLADELVRQGEGFSIWIVR